MGANNITTSTRKKIKSVQKRNQESSGNGTTITATISLIPFEQMYIKKSGMKTTAGYIPDFFIYIYLLQTSRLFVNYKLILARIWSYQIKSVVKLFVAGILTFQKWFVTIYHKRCILLQRYCQLILFSFILLYCHRTEVLVLQPYNRPAVLARSFFWE